MDWYYGSDVDDLVVPKDQEPLDRLLSPDSWSQWGITAPESFATLNKYLVKGTNSAEEQHNFNVNMDISIHDGAHSSISSIYGGLLEVSLNTLPRERPDFQLRDLAGIDEMDDIFLSSLLEEDMTATEDLHGSFSYSPDSQHGIMSADNLMTDVNLGSESISSHLFGMGSSKYHKTHAFSPSVGWEKGEVASSCLNFCNPRQIDSPAGKAMVVKVSTPSEQSSGDGYTGDETSLEESVLQELERVMAQLTEKTRISFRDALYRLAEQHTANQSHNGDPIPEKRPPLTVHDETFRLGKANATESATKATESATNTIDRAIANLMFNKMDCNARDIPTAASAPFKGEAIGTKGPFDYSLDEPQFPHSFLPTSLAGDAEVPTFG